MYAEAYQRGQTRVVQFMDGRDPETAVPATPEWSALDVVRHLTGLSVDLSNLVLEGFASDEWTDRQVSSRREMSIDEVIAEWDNIIGPASVLLDAIDDLEKLLNNNRIFRDRTEGIGAISPDDAVAWGLSAWRA